MALNLNLEEEEVKGNLGFETALFIDVPYKKKEISTNKLNSEVISLNNTPDQNKYNKSLISNLISVDLLKRLEEESPYKINNQHDDFVENQKYFCKKLSFDRDTEDDYENDNNDSDTKVSKSKMSKDSDSLSDKINERKSNSLHLFSNSNDKKIEFNKVYPSSMENKNLIFQSSNEYENPFGINKYFFLN